MKTLPHAREDSLLAAVFLSFMATAGLFYVNIMSAIVDGLMSGLHFSAKDAGLVASANVYGAALGALTAVFVVKYVPWRKVAIIILGLLMALDASSMLVQTPNLLIALRFADGLIGGLLVGLSYGVIARTKVPERVFGVLLVVQFGLGGLGLMYLPRLVPHYGYGVLFLSLAAFSTLARGGDAIALRIEDPGCVAKTYPDYFEALFALARTDVASIPVIAIDGPSGSGKGTLASAVAQKLGYQLLDSGLVYRAVALLSLRKGIATDDAVALTQLASNLGLSFDAAGQALLDGEDVTDQLRSEAVGAVASKISVWPAVRSALLSAQLHFRALPGLVADGRDMGTVVFPDAKLKVYLTASARTRADRRYKQLISKGFQANIDGLHADLMQRDARDQNRSSAPLTIAEDALLLDNSTLSIDDSVNWVLDAWQMRGPFGKTQAV